ncbi:hypothetical protein PSTG_11415 [Puccinia striiformis f. sp. tritici PST-78]|uniref:Uncharacterized protein n=2 Tax=Puccinia striiformis f. sp. tritici TaxID=168172 RepID=A0A0L0V7J1_9BASI|nr:hypothetical protein PSTG_11415 [Puccinia striiformis f. sp. tritici PST-78]
MNLALLPLFGGDLHEPWELHELRLLSWLRVHQIPEDDDKIRVDCLVLSLKPNSSPLYWFNGQPNDLKSSFVHALHLLRNKYASDLRKEMQMISALNCLEVRSFRDSEHKTEMVFELINELEQLLTCGSVDQDVQRRECLLRCFRGFSGALKMMNRTTSYDGAVLAALNWESSVISKAEEAMIQAGIKRQLGQKSQNAQARTKRKSNATRPVNQSDHQQATAESSHQFTTQDFQAHTDPVRLHPDVYYKTHLPSSQQKSGQNSPPDNSSHPLQHRYNENQDSSHKKPGQSNHAACNASSVSATAYATPPTRVDTDPSQMMESLVDPHIAPQQFNSQPGRFEHQPNSYEHLAGMNTNEQEVLHNPSMANTYPQKSQIKPLIYDPKKNPYPPPEQLPENRQSSGDQLERNQRSFPTSSSLNLRQSSSQQVNIHGMTNQSQPDSIPFPSPSGRTQPLASFQPTRRSPLPQMTGESQHSTTMFRGSSPSQHGTQIFDSATNIDSTASLTQGQYSFDPLSRRRSGGGSSGPQRRPSKLVKLRRKGSNSSNNSSQRSSSSLRHIRNFIGSVSRRSNRASQSGEESDSTQDHGPNTPSSLEPGGIGSGVESESNERMRPMQAQFSRLFRKHNHPEHLRRANRSMLVKKPVPDNQVNNPNKGKARALDVNSAATGTVDEFFARRNQAGRPSGSILKSSLNPQASINTSPSNQDKNKPSIKPSRWRTSGI